MAEHERGAPKRSMAEKREVLRWAPGLTVELRDGGEVAVRTDRGTFAGSAHVLAALDAFAHPRTLEEGMRSLAQRSAGATEWMDLATAVHALMELGALVGEDGGRARFGAGAGFDNAAIHIRMLDDRPRTAAFLAAIQREVRPGDVVVEIGTGTGILSLGAARAGARKVYAIEAGEVGGAARALWEANGVADRIELLRGWSTRLELPERADVLVSEIIGNEPLGERVLEVFLDARRRLLRPDARVIPRALQLLALPVAVPARYLSRHAMLPGAVAKWSRWYGADFAALGRAETTRRGTFFVRPHRARRWPRPTEPIELGEIDLAGLATSSCEAIGEAPVREDGRLSGVLIAFELDMGDAPRVTTLPEDSKPSNSWTCPVFLLRDEARVRRGQRVRVHYRSSVRDASDRIAVEIVG